MTDAARRTRGVAFAALLAALPVASAVAQAPVQPQFKGAISGYPQKVDFYYFVNPDCSLGGVPAVRLVNPPSQGKVVIAAGQDFPNYPNTNPRVACNAQRTAGTVVTYQSTAGYTGPDQFRLSTVYPSGEVRIRDYIVDVQR